MFSAKHEKGESVTSRGSSIDETQNEFKEAATKVCNLQEILGAFT
jgi:hypothetical protein